MQDQQPKTLTNQDLNQVIIKLARFLFKKNLLEQFKSQHQQQTPLITNIQHHIDKPQPKKRPVKPRRKPQKPKEQPDEENHLQPMQLSQTPGPEPIANVRWRVQVREYQEFVKSEYYVFEEVYYKLKGAGLTKFQFNFKLDMVNTQNNKREELIITKSKRIYWASTTKIPVTNEDSNQFVALPSGQKIPIENPVYLEAIRKYWNKATFYAVVPMTNRNQPLPQLIFIEFNY